MGPDGSRAASASGTPVSGRPAGLLLGTGIGLHHPGPTRRDLYGSLAFHVAILVSLAVSGALNSRDLPEFETFRVQLFSPPAQVEGPPVPQPEVTETIVQTPTIERPVETPRTEPEVQRPEQTLTTEEEPEEVAPAAGDRPDPDSPGGDDISVETDGREFPYPDYLENIIVQMRRYFRWSGEGSPQIVVAFYISRDGSVGGFRTVEKSGDWRFDLQVADAVTQAGRRGAFGPLPDGWVQDRLWVRFTFIPPGR